MANTKSRKSTREPRLYWHELPLGHLPIHGEVTMHEVRKALLPMLARALFHCFHRPQVIRAGDVLTTCHDLWLGPAERRVSVHSGLLTDHNEVRLSYRLGIAKWMMYWQERQKKRFERIRRLNGWLAEGKRGGVSLYLRRHRRWKGGRYLVEE